MFNDILVTESFEPLHDYERAEKFAPCHSCTEWEKKCSELEARLEECRKDAQRYCWLRTNAIECRDTVDLNMFRSIKNTGSKSCSEIDAAIDFAMKAGRGVF